MSSKILRLHIDSSNGVNDVDIEFPQDKQIFALIADGQKGKSSILNFIEACLKGVVPDDMINTLTGKAKGSLDIATTNPDGSKTVHTIELSKTRKSETVRIKSNGMHGGKEALRALVGQVAINPFEFKDLKPSEQIIEYKRLCKIDTTEIDTTLKELSSERVLIGRKARDLQGWIEAHNENSIDLEEKAIRLKDPIELAPLLEEQKKAVQHNQLIEQKSTDIANLSKDLQRFEEQKQEILNQMEALQKRLYDVTAKQSQIMQQIDSEKQEFVKLVPIEVAEIAEKIQKATAHNEERTNFEEFRIKLKEHTEAQKEYDQKTEEIAKAREKKAEIIKNSQIKVAGLEFREPTYDEKGVQLTYDEGMFYEGRPIRSLSTTEIVKLGVMIKNAIDHYNGFKGLPVLIVDDFESIGSDGVQEIEKLCREENYQAIVAYMDRTVPNLKVVIKEDLNFDDATKDQILTTKNPAQKKDSPKKDKTETQE